MPTGLSVSTGKSFSNNSGIKLVPQGVTNTGVLLNAPASQSPVVSTVPVMPDASLPLQAINYGGSAGLDFDFGKSEDNQTQYYPMPPQKKETPWALILGAIAAAFAMFTFFTSKKKK